MRNLTGYANIRADPRPVSKRDACLTARLNDTSQPLASSRMGKLFDLERAGLEAAPGTPAQFGQWIRTESERWGRVIRAQPITLE